MFARLLPALALAACAIAPKAEEARPAAAMSAWAAACGDWDEWDKPGPPFQVVGNTWYVGTCGISAILITGDKGHILIDGGPEGSAHSIIANIEALGFDPKDVKIQLHSHEHHDHVGGIAELQRLTGAQLVASKQAAPAFTTGHAVPDDPQLAEKMTIPVARIDGTVADGEVVRLGNLALTAIATPGHTPGALSWKWDSLVGEDSAVEIVYADSLTPVSSDGYRFTDHPAYLEQFRHSVEKIAALNCRLLLAPHPSAAQMRSHILEGSLSSRTACKDYAAGLREKLAERLANEATAK